MKKGNPSGKIVFIIVIALAVVSLDTFQKFVSDLYRWNYWACHSTVECPKGYIRTFTKGKAIVYSEEDLSKSDVESFIRGDYSSERVQVTNTRRVKKIRLGKETYILKEFKVKPVQETLLFSHVVCCWNNGLKLESITHAAKPICIMRTLGSGGEWNSILMKDCGLSIGAQIPQCLPLLVRQVRQIQSDLENNGFYHGAISCSNMVGIEGQTYLVDFDDACKFPKKAFLAKRAYRLEGKDFDEAEEHLDLAYGNR